MSTSAIGDGPSGPESSQVESKNPRRMGSSIRVLVMLVVCCGAMFVVWRTVWDNRHPALAAARGLRSSTPSQRLAAIRELSEQASGESAEAIRPLIAALDDPDAGVRAAAAQALGLIGSYSARSVPHAEEVRAAAAELLASLKDREPSVRVAAAGALRLLAGSSLAGTSQDNGRGKGKGKGQGKAKASEGARPAASTVDQAAAAAALLDLLGDPDAEVRQAAIFALGIIALVAFDEPPPSLFAAMEDQSTANRAAVINTLAGFPRGLDPLIPSLLRHLEKDEPAVREACIAGLIRIRPAALTSAAATDLIAGLGDRNRDVRLHIASLLGRISPDPGTAVPALIAVLRESADSDATEMGGRTMVVTHEGPAEEAARALGRIARSTPAAGAAIAALTEVVQSGPAQRRASAADALGEFGPAAAKAVPGLITMVEQDAVSKTPTTDGESAIRALGRIAPGTPSASQVVTALTAALNSEAALNRETAIKALTRFGAAAAGAIPALREIQEKDRVPNLRKAAASALEELKDGSK